MRTERGGQPPEQQQLEALLRAAQAPAVPLANYVIATLPVVARNRLVEQLQYLANLIIVRGASNRS